MARRNKATIAELARDYGLEEEEVREWVGSGRLVSAAGDDGEPLVAVYDLIRFVDAFPAGHAGIDNLKEVNKFLGNALKGVFENGPLYPLYFQCLYCGRFAGSTRVHYKPSPGQTHISHVTCSRCARTVKLQESQENPRGHP